MIDPMDLDTPLFTVEQTAHAIDRSYQLIKKWQGGGITIISPFDTPGSAGRGRRTRYTLRTVITLGLMAEMTAWGTPADTALSSALNLTVPSAAPDRKPGEIFSRGQTLLVVRDKREPAELVNVHGEAPFEWPDVDAASTLLIDCEKVWKRVIDRLDAYGGPT